MSLEALQDVKYISLETFRKNGQGVKTPLWLVSDRENLYAWTQTDSWKVKRIRNNSQVRVCQSDARGKPLSEWIDANARILDDNSTIENVESLMAAKYGLFFRGFHWIYRLRKTPHVVVEISA